MNYNDIINEIRKEGIKNIILDTDAYNEIDDQFAISYAIKSRDKLNILAICAAPFFNHRSLSAEDGMEKSYEEIYSVIRKTDPNCSIPVYRGSRVFMTDGQTPVASEAADKIAELVLSSRKRVFIVAIGAITNVASAIIKYPQIKENAIVIWLGGHALHYPVSDEFNMQEDIYAAKAVFESGIPLVQIPCGGVCSELITTQWELEHYLSGKNEICDYLIQIFRDYEYVRGRAVASKVIWDISAIAVLTAPDAFDMAGIPKPVITTDMRYAFDMTKERYIYIRKMKRDKIFEDLFKKISHP